MAITRRTALQALGLAGATALLPRRLPGGREPEKPDSDVVGILYDSTRCIGCRQCAVGCAEANGWDPAQALSDDPKLTYASLTVVRRYVVGDDDVFRKVSCMHCKDPACVSACMLGAMSKDEDGAVTWNGDLCVGCRYCEIACPFNAPRFEWETPVPSLQKCQLCPERRAQGLPPACVEQCRRGALVYGTREEMLREAHRRIDASPGTYNPKVFGEHDGGGTSVLYLAKAGVSFAELGLPELGEESVATLPETIQHTLYRGAVAPLALLAALGAVVRRNTRKLRAEEAAFHRTEVSAPVGGKILTSPFVLLSILVVLGMAAVFWRFAHGLGATTNLNDGYPMGLWIAFDVVTGTALACGGYAMALLVYVANRGRYHPLVRAALVTSAFGYTLGGVSVLIDIGRAWNFYKIPLFFWEWNFNSILLEVALCIMFYTMVLWIEVSPVFLDRWKESRVEGLRRLAVNLSPRLERAMPWLIAVGLLLPTMHQSSLGSLMLMAGRKLHPLWHTPLLPLLFLVSCVAMGYAVVTLEAVLSSRAFKRPSETPMLRALALPVSAVLLAFAAIRMVDIVHQGKLELVTRMDGYSLLFLGEMALFVLPALGLLLRRRTARGRYLVAMATLVVGAGALYRFSTYLFAFNPGEEWSYFPAIPEFAVTIGLVSAEILGYLILVKRFPILRGVAAPSSEVPPPVPPSSRSPDMFRDPMRPVGVGASSVSRCEAVPEGGASPVGGLTLVLAAAAALAVVGGVRPVLAEPVPQQRDSVNAPDLRCLTRRSEDCLAAPVPADEPHGAVCAVCHDLWSGQVPAKTARPCVDAGCHSAPETLTAFHRTVSAAVLQDCVGCHRAHAFRVEGGGRSCTVCHASGGVPMQGTALRGRATVPASLAFSHEDHGAVSCLQCHGTAQAHGTVEVRTRAACRACHHTAPLDRACEACHVVDEVRATAFDVTRALNIRIGSLDQPRRVIRFDHANHWHTDCTVCHTGGPDLGTAQGADCSGCHLEHHQATANCNGCHERPAEGAHTRDAHLGCGGAGCHDPVPEGIRLAPRTRNLCLACHTDRLDHKPGQTCSGCHQLPEVGG